MELSELNTAGSALLKSRQGSLRRKLKAARNQLDTSKNVSDKQSFDTKRLKEACYDLEGLFINKMMKIMRRNIPKGGLFEKSNAENIFEDMLYEKYADRMARGRTDGIANAMYQQLAQDM